MFSIILTLLLLLDPIGNVPIFIAKLQHFSLKRQLKLILRELLVALGIMLVFFYFGEYCLDLLHVSEETIQVTGGLILGITALKMIYPSNEKKKIAGSQEEEPFIVPLAVPLVAGPAVLTTLMLYSHSAFSHVTVLMALLISWTINALIMLSAPFAQKIIGPRGLKAGEVLMGMILLMLAVEMFLSGTKTFMSL